MVRRVCPASCVARRKGIEDSLQSKAHGSWFHKQKFLYKQTEFPASSYTRQFARRGYSYKFHIARNSGHFAPVINCQRNLISKMADKNDRSQGKRIPCDFLNNLSSVDLFYEEKSWNETSCKKMLGLYSAERLIATKQYATVPFVTFSWHFRDNFVLKPSLVS